jgi:hypothetical protein
MQAAKEAHLMVNLRRNARQFGATLSATTLALLAAQGVASAQASSDVLEGTVSSVTAGMFTVATADGRTDAVVTTPATTYAESGSTTALPGLTDGERVAVRLDPSTATPTATRVTVLLDRLSGRVIGVNGSTVRLAERHGHRTFEVSPATQYIEGGTAATGVADGDFVTAFGMPAAAPNELVATYVDITAAPAPPRPVSPTPAVMPPGSPHGGSWPDPATGPGARPGWTGTPPAPSTTPQPTPPVGDAGRLHHTGGVGPDNGSSGGPVQGGPHGGPGPSGGRH